MLLQTPLHPSCSPHFRRSLIPPTCVQSLPCFLHLGFMLPLKWSLRAVSGGGGGVLVNMSAFQKTSRNAVWRVNWRGKEVGKWSLGHYHWAPTEWASHASGGGSCTGQWQGLLWIVPEAQDTNHGQPHSRPKAGDGKASFHFPISQQISQQPEIVPGCLTSSPQKTECYHSQCLLPVPLFFQKLGSNWPWGDDSEHWKGDRFLLL